MVMCQAEAEQQIGLCCELGGEKCNNKAPFIFKLHLQHSEGQQGGVETIVPSVTEISLLKCCDSLIISQKTSNNSEILSYYFCASS